MSDQAVFLPKWFSGPRISLAKRKLDHTYTAKIALLAWNSKKKNCLEALWKCQGQDLGQSSTNWGFSKKGLTV